MSTEIELFAGTSGFSYKAWKGSFYPAELKDREMLRLYGERLGSVEINSTFYRMPREEMLANWREQVPNSFRFVIKAPQRITHRARLKNAGELVERLWQAMGGLGDRRGPILFQLPPNFKADEELLATFLKTLPSGCEPALEFRHPSWDSTAVQAILRSHGVALCINDPDDGPTPEIRPTADWGYLRLRRQNYGDGELEEWLGRIQEAGWKRAFVFFKHEDEGAAPRLAQRLMALSGL